MHARDRVDWPSMLVSGTLAICLTAGSAIALAGLYFVVTAFGGRGGVVQTLLAAI